jgi:putative transposase
MRSVTTKPASSHPRTDTAVDLFDNWIDPIEIEVRERVRGFIEELIREELDAALARPRYGRPANDVEKASATSAGVVGHRHGGRPRTLMGTFGKVEINVPRARLRTADGGTTEAKSCVPISPVRSRPMR